MRIGKRLAQMLDPSNELFPESERLDFAQEEVWHPDCLATPFGIPEFEDIAARARATKPLAIALDDHQVSLLSLHVLFEPARPLLCLSSKAHWDKAYWDKGISSKLFHQRGTASNERTISELAVSASDGVQSASKSPALICTVIEDLGSTLLVR